ncbi:MAG: M48 family metalloprotease [Nitrospirae bacterium YQR-1]
MIKILNHAVVFFILCSASVVFADNKDSTVWWIDKHHAVEAKDNPLVGRAERVFERVGAVADKRGDKPPKFFVIKGKGEPWAVSLPDGGILLTEGVLKICYENVSPAEGDSRVAFIIGHELAHLANNDFWHRESFMAFNEQYDEKKADDQSLKAIFESTDDSKKKELAKMKELQADHNGIIYMTLAGYEPKQIVGKRNFFESWTAQVTGRVAYRDNDHPTPKERAEFLRTQLTPVADALDLFTFGVRLYQLGRFEDADMFFKEYAKKFPGREVFNNRGLSHFNMALKVLSGCDANLVSRFYLPTVLYLDTYGGKLVLRGTSTRDARTSECMTNKTFTKHMKEAVNYLTKAVEMESGSVAVRINLSSAFIVLEDYSKAMGVADEALKIKEMPEAVSNKAIALYYFGKTNNLGETADSAIKMLSETSSKNPAFSGAYYNMGRIQTDLKRTASAKESFTRFLDLEKSGLYAEAARKALKTEGDKQLLKSAKMESPLKLGNVKASADKLKRLKESPVKIVEFEGRIYEGDNLKVLVINDGKDDNIEIVEQTVDPAKFPLPVEKPVRRIKTNLGETLVYENFAVDVTDNQVRKVVYFMNGV